MSNFQLYLRDTFNKFPDNNAIQQEDKVITYRQLEILLANKVAHIQSVS